MHHRTIWIAVFLIAAFTLGGCSIGSNSTTSVANQLTATAPSPGTAPARGTSQPTATQILQIGQSFQINQRAQSSQDALKNVDLVVRSASITTDSLVLRIAFQNTSNTAYDVFGELGGADAVLVDGNGQQYKPSKISESLRSLAPAQGFGPGTANVGNLTFPQPSGSGPYQLRMPSYPPISFQLDTPLSIIDPVLLNEGTYVIDQTVQSQEPALATIALQLQSLQIMSNTVVFNIAFVNTGRQGYNLMVGPSGRDARLVDAEGQQYEPISIGATLATSLAPPGGWQPGQANQGTLTFPRPNASDMLRFVFPTYNAVSMRFDAEGLAEATITSPSGGTPAPTLTPRPADAAYAAIAQLLTQQATALQTGNVDAYLATLDPALRDEQRSIVERIKQAPLVSYTLQLAADANLSNTDSITLENVPVEISYTLRGINLDNRFLHQARYSFTQDSSIWRVSKIELGSNPPFWRLGDFVLRETPHFLLFARPAAQDSLPALEQETEQAYATLQQRGLTLEPRYVAYFTNTDDEFSTLTGQPASRYLGLALSRYTFNGTTVAATSRAFYINGAAFRENADLISPTERQTTITHELVHLALAASTRPFTPPWLAEGMAVFYSEDIGTAQRQQLATSGQLDDISLTDLTKAGSLGERDYTAERVEAEYMYSGAAVAYLTQTFGENTVRDFYRSYAAVPAADVRDQLPQLGGSLPTDAAFADLSSNLTSSAVQQFFGRSIEQLDANVKAWIRNS